MNDQRPPEQEPDPEVDVDAAFRDIVARLDQEGLDLDQEGLETGGEDPDGSSLDRGKVDRDHPGPADKSDSGPASDRPRHEIDLTDDSSLGNKASDDEEAEPVAGAKRPDKPATNPPMTFKKKRPISTTKSQGINNSPRSYELAEPDDSFTPDPPPSWSSFSGRSYLTWIPLASSLIFLLICAVFWRSAPKPLLYLAVALFAGGVVMLFTGLSNEHDDGDDGARF